MLPTKDAPRKLVLKVELSFDEWTAEHVGSDALLISELKEELSDGMLGGARVRILKLDSTEAN